MTDKLFLTGPSGCGKTTSILRLLPSFSGSIGGFIVQRLVSNTKPLGYCMVPSRKADKTWLETEKLPKTCFLTVREQELKFDANLFTQSFLELTADGDLIILDEIGGVELQISEVRARILSLLNSDTPLLAIWKSKENLLQMIQKGKASSDLLLLHQEMESQIRSHPRARFLEASSGLFMPELIQFFGFLQKRKEHQ